MEETMALFAQLGKDRDLDALIDTARRYEWDRHDPLIRSVVDHPELASARDVAQVRERVTAFSNFHREHPWRVLPPGLLDGPYTIAIQGANGAPICLGSDQLCRHGLIFGGSGSGKTTLVASLVRQFLAQGVKVLVDDYKDDSLRLAATDERFVILDEHAQFNPLQRPVHLSLAEFVALLVDAVAQVYYGGQNLKRYLTAALMQAFRDHEQPCMADLAALIERSIDKRSTFTERDAAHGLLQRLERFGAMYPGMFRCRHGITTDALFNQSLYLPQRVTSEAGQLLLALLVQLLFQHQRGRQHRGGLEYMLILDEGMMTWSAHQTNIDEEPLLASLMTMVRESGIGMIVTSTTAVVAPILQSNAFLQIALNMTSGDDTAAIARTFEMTPEEQHYFATRLQRGQCIIRLGDTWRHPILASFQRDNERKDVTDHEWKSAIERTKQLAQNASRQTEQRAAREGIGGNGQQPTAQATAPSASPPSRVAPVVETPPNTGRHASAIAEEATIAPNVDQGAVPPNERPRVALNKHTTALLHDVADHPYTLCGPAYGRNDLLLAQGDRARGQGERLGLLCATRVTCGRGRGKTGISLALSAEGWRTIDRTPTKGLRGGSSAQHSFCVFELHRRIPGSLIEEYLGAKAVDLAVPYNTKHHEPLLHAVTALNGKTPRLHDGDIIALEVEISSKSQSAIRNATKDAAAGVALTILAVADRQPERLALTLPSNAIVLDVFALLDALRTTP